MKILNTLKKLTVLGTAALMAVSLYSPVYAANTAAKAKAKTKTVMNNQYVIDSEKNVYSWTSLSKKSEGSLYMPETDYDGNQYICVLDGKPSNLKSSNSSVVAPVLGEDEYDDGMVYSLSLDVKKAGTATISWTDLNGTKCQIKNTVKKYTSPVKSIKVGSKNYTSKVKTTPRGEVNTSVKGKVSVKTKKNWKVKSIRVAKNHTTIQNYGVTKYSFKGTTNATSKKAIDLKGYKVLDVTLYNTKTKEYSSVFIGSYGALFLFNVSYEN